MTYGVWNANGTKIYEILLGLVLTQRKLGFLCVYLAGFNAPTRIKIPLVSLLSFWPTRLILLRRKNLWVFLQYLCPSISIHSVSLSKIFLWCFFFPPFSFLLSFLSFFFLSFFSFTQKLCKGQVHSSHSFFPCFSFFHPSNLSIHVWGTSRHGFHILYGPG